MDFFRRGTEAPSSSTAAPSNSEDNHSEGLCATNSNNSNSPQDIMKRSYAKQLIERYFYQLLDGCGNPNCDNKDCASSGEVSCHIIFSLAYARSGYRTKIKRIS